MDDIGITDAADKQRRRTADCSIKQCSTSDLANTSF